MSAVDPLTAVPEHRRRYSPDIIDIDALDADDVIYVGSARPRQRRRVGEDGRAVSVTREVINITDSEDDNEIQFIGHNPARPSPPLVRRHRIFSPPPPQPMGGIPPVPPIPERFLPLRQHPPPGLIIPNEDPLPFEADLRPLSVEQPLPAAAAPSHHIPSMGFGGALIAGVRRLVGPRNTSRRHERRNSWGVSGAFVMRWDPFDFVDREDDLLEELDDTGFLNEDHPFGAGRMRSQIEQAFKQRDRGNRAEPDYQPEYTHPDQPQPGFTHDFSFPLSSSSPTEEDHASSSCPASSSRTRLYEATLVCAACRDPLLVGASDIGADRAKRKLWSLRCGHLFDGKCIQKLLEPVAPTSDTSGSSCTVKAPESERHLGVLNEDTVLENSSSMRSRLRPRRGAPGPLTPAPIPLSGRRRASVATHRSNRKGKGKMKAPAAEAEHEWSCPVSGCGRVHLSFLMDGRWTMDEKRGGIVVFV